MLFLILLIIIIAYAKQLQLFQSPLLDSNQVWNYTVNSNHEYFCQDHTCYFPDGWSTYPANYAIIFTHSDAFYATCTQSVKIPDGLFCNNFQLTISIRSFNNTIGIFAIWNDKFIDFNMSSVTVNYTNITVTISDIIAQQDLKSGILIKNNKQTLAINGIYLIAECSDINISRSDDSTSSSTSNTSSSSEESHMISYIIRGIIILMIAVIGAILIYLIYIKFYRKPREPKFIQLEF